MSHPLFDLSGRIALVSGAASGLGRAMALGFAEAGADLLLADKNTAGIEDTAGQIEGLGRRALPRTCDVSEPTQIDALFAQLDRDYGAIHILGNVAGDTRKKNALKWNAFSGQVIRILDTNSGDWRSILVRF